MGTNATSISFAHFGSACTTTIKASRASTSAPYTDDDASWQTRRRFYSDCLLQKGSFVLLAYSGEELIGYALVLVQPTSSMWSDTWVVGDRTAELETIVVAPEWRGRGVASRLMDRVETELEKLGIKDVIIGAVPTNSEVLELYRRRGFESTWLVMTRFAKRGRERAALNDGLRSPLFTAFFSGFQSEPWIEFALGHRSRESDLRLIGLATAAGHCLSDKIASVMGSHNRAAKISATPNRAAILAHPEHAFSERHKDNGGCLLPVRDLSRVLMTGFAGPGWATGR